ALSFLAQVVQRHTRACHRRIGLFKQGREGLVAELLAAPVGAVKRQHRDDIAAGLALCFVFELQVKTNAVHSPFRAYWMRLKPKASWSWRSRPRKVMPLRRKLSAWPLRRTSRLTS